MPSVLSDMGIICGTVKTMRIKLATTCRKDLYGYCEQQLLRPVYRDLCVYRDDSLTVRGLSCELNNQLNVLYHFRN